MIKRGYLVGIVLVCLTTACTNKPIATKEVFRKVKLHEVTPYKETKALHFVGKVIPHEEITLSFQVSGTIVDIPVKVGQSVQKGTLLASLDARDYATRLQATSAQFNQIKGESERIVELYQRQSVPRNDYEKAVAGLEQISAQLRAHQDAVADCRLTAPIAARVQRIHMQSGEAATMSRSVITLVDDTSLELELFLPAPLYLKLQQQPEAFEYSVSSTLQHEELCQITLLSATPKANANGLYAVRFALHQTGKRQFAIGMNIEVVIRERGVANQRVSIPIHALFASNGRSSVWVFNSETKQAEKRLVGVSELSADGFAIIQEGVVAGEQVIVAGIGSITEQMRLQPLPQESETNIGRVK